MARYDVYANPAGGYVIDVQADLLDALRTQLVIPLLPFDSAPAPAARLNPCFVIDGERYVLVTQFMAAVPVSSLKKPVANFASSHDVILAALDKLFH